jgi:hypothetical protein
MKWRIGRASDPTPKPKSVREQEEQERTDAVIACCSCLALIVVAILGALALLIYGVWYFSEATERTIPISI